MSDNKTWYFVKLKDDYFSIEEVDYLLSLEHGAEYLALYQMLCLKTLNKDGRMERKMGEMIIPYDVEYIKKEAKHFSSEMIKNALEIYEKLGLVCACETEELKKVNMLGMEVGKDNSEAKRKREARKRQRTNGRTYNGQMSDKCPTNVHQSIEYRDKSIENRNKKINKKSCETQLVETVSKDSNFSAKREIEKMEIGQDLKNALFEFLKMRKGMKAPVNTKTALTRLLNRLDKLADNEQDKIELVNEAIERSWKTFYKNEQTQKEKESDPYKNYQEF